jgi:hypothetical protein
MMTNQNIHSYINKKDHQSKWLNDLSKMIITVPPRSFHTNINYFRGIVKKKEILRGEVRNVKQTKLINSTV